MAPEESPDEEKKVDFGRLVIYKVKTKENDKMELLLEYLEDLEFNQCIVFVGNIERAEKINQFLKKEHLPSLVSHSKLSQKERIQTYDHFKHNKGRILVATDLFGRGIDFRKVNLVINFDMPCRNNPVSTFVHRIGRAGRFGGKGLSVSFLSSSDDDGVIGMVEKKYSVVIKSAPKRIDPSSYLDF